MRMRWAGLAALWAALAAASPAWAITSGQIDTFSGTTTEGWAGGASPTHIATGGPAGVGDGYLQFERSAFPFHLGGKNESQWSGNYLTAGVGGLELDMAASLDLQIRIALNGPGGFFSTATPKPLTSSAGWQHLSFDLDLSELVYVSGGTGTLTDTLAAVQTLLIRHDSDPTPSPPGLHPEHVLGTLGLDNIEAMAAPVPTPSAAAMGAAAAGLLVFLRLRRRR